MSTPLEIERKYLIEYPDVAWLERDPDVTKYEITQTYLSASDGEERRVRMRREGDTVTYYETVKRKVTDVTREERETIITKETYETLLAEADPTRRPVKKTRYCLPYGGSCIEIDLYPFWTDRAIAEVELPDETTPVSFPQALKVIREVTGERAYKNSELAKI